MYNKVKYLIYVSFILFFILMFTAIQNRSSQVAEQRAQEKFQKELMEKTEKYQKMADEQNKKQRQENTEQKEDYSSSFVPAEQPSQQENYVKPAVDSQNETGSVSGNNEEDIDNNSTQDKLYFAADNTEAVGYILCKRFDFEGNNYAVVAVDDTQYVSEYSKYLNRKFYIYKRNAQNMERIHYLFEKSVDKSDKSVPDISVEVNKYDVKITYNTRPPVSRTVSHNILVNIGYQYKDVPVLKIYAANSGDANNLQENKDNIQLIPRINEPQN